MSAVRSGTAILAHSGGPTPVINGSLLGVVHEAREHREINALYGARFGIDGILTEDFMDLFRQPTDLLEQIAHTPSSALGTSRREVSASDLVRTVEIFRRHNARFLFYTGGNGSMGTANQIASAAAEQKYELQVIGIPKTIDNDLMETDHTPGYPSVARFFAMAVRDIDADNRALRNQIEFVEVLGRNAGWLVAATSLARTNPDDAPHLIYVPEHRLSIEQLLTDIDKVYSRLQRCVIAVCEGQLDDNGQPFGADVRAGSRGTLAMNLAHRLAMIVSERLKVRARSEKPGLLARASSWTISKTDWKEAYALGREAVAAAIRGETGKMVAMRRSDDLEYSVTMTLVDLEKVAYVERTLPLNWVNEQRNDLLPEFRIYASSLIGPIPAYKTLD